VNEPLVQRIAPYGIDPDSAEGLRERIAATYPAMGARHEKPAVHQPVMVRRPDGEWVAL
jgi:hypothetical protein